MKIEFNINSDISSYSLDDVLRGVELENNGEQVFVFDSNFSLMHFFNYFIEETENVEDFKTSSILNEYIQLCINVVPKNFNDCVDRCFSLVELDDDIKTVFSITTPQVICAFLYTNFSALIYDDLFLFYNKSELQKNLIETLKTEDTQQIIYEIVLQVSYKIKKTLPVKEYTFETFPLLPKDIENLKNVPKDLNSAIDWIVESLEKHKPFMKTLDFDGNESVDVLTCFIYGQVSHVLLYTWYLYHEKSPLKIWFETQRQIKDPYYMVYYLIRNFANYITLKYSLNNAV